MILNWQENTNLENSLMDFLQEQIEGDSAEDTLTVIHEGKELPINVRIGFPEDNSWKLPVISLYEQSTNRPKNFVGTSAFQAETLMIIDIRALYDRMRSDLAVWVAGVITAGFPYYEYAPNPSNPDQPLKVLKGRTIVNFQTDGPVRLQNVDVIDLFRHRMTIAVEIN